MLSTKTIGDMDIRIGAMGKRLKAVTITTTAMVGTIRYDKEDSLAGLGG
jgi:hypothetical protein